MGDVSYLADSKVMKIPIVRSLFVGAEGLVCPRGGSNEEKQKLVELIRERQKSIEENRNTQSPIFIFAEGATTNNTVIGPFKRGASESLCSVRPVTFQYYCPLVMPADETLNDADVVPLFLCCPIPSICRVTIHPVFTPNEHLY